MTRKKGWLGDCWWGYVLGEGAYRGHPAYFYKVYNDLGFGFVEVVYARAMALALKQAGLHVECEAALPVSYLGEVLGVFKADCIVNGKVLLEYKVAEQISKAHEAQVTNYLKATALEVGLILNFGASPKARRIEFRNERKRTLPNRT